MVHSVMSCNQGFGMFSNNNYLPDVGQFSNNNTYVSRCQQPTGAQGVQFTFAVPTQASSYGFSLGSTHQPRGIYSNPINTQNIVPGLGTPWQHSIPNPMPWSEDSIPQGNSGVSAFSAYPPVSSAFNIYSNVPSCTKTTRRPKRHSSTDIEKEAPGSKCRVTAEKMAARMEGLSLTCAGTPSGGNLSEYQFQPSLELDLDDIQSRNSCTYMSEDWKKFRELENRLNSESEDDDILDSNNGIKVHISEDIAKNILESAPLLPQKILNSVKKPCMELVLWKSPGGFDRDNVKQELPVTSSGNQTIPTSVPILSVDSNIPLKYDMESDSVECFDDQMDL